MATHALLRGETSSGLRLHRGFYSCFFFFFGGKGLENTLKLDPTVREKYAFDVGKLQVLYVTAGVEG